MTTKNFSTQQRPDTCSNQQKNVDEQDSINANSRQNVSGKDDDADSNCSANSHNLADYRFKLTECKSCIKTLGGRSTCKKRRVRSHYRAKWSREINTVAYPCGPH